jgi:hypothetical protein
LAAVYAVGNKKKIPLWHSVKKTRMSERDVTVNWIEIFGFIASKGTAKQKSKKDFIMKNCSAKKQLEAGKILQCRTAL